MSFCRFLVHGFLFYRSGRYKELLEKLPYSCFFGSFFKWIFAPFVILFVPKNPLFCRLQVGLYYFQSICILQLKKKKKKQKGEMVIYSHPELRFE